MATPIWNTSAGSIGTFTALSTVSVQLSASAVLPAVSVTYKIISGSLAPGLSLSEEGVISGTTQQVSSDISYRFVVRATDNLQNIQDRTFSLTISGIAIPRFITAAGSIATTLDSVWTEIPILYENPVETNEVKIRVVQGSLPPGLEISENGLVRGYPAPPVLTQNLGLITSTSTAVQNNTIICETTLGFRVGRPVVFSGNTIGGIVQGQVYYIRSIISLTSFTISQTVNGPLVELTDDLGFMDITLPNVSVGRPTVQNYSFTLRLASLLGDDVQNYSITVVNQNASLADGGPGLPNNTRVPTIYNTRPPSFNIGDDVQNFGYYLLPSGSEGTTYSPSEFAYIGQFSSDDFFSFRMLGHDFDNNPLEYVFADVPLGLQADPATGWIQGTPIISDNNINQFNFSVFARKTINPSITTPTFNFSFRLANNILGEVKWLTDSNLGELFNGTISTLKVEATSDVTLEYRIISGQLPPNLKLLSNGEISGVSAYQPTEDLLPLGETVPFTFTVESYSPQFGAIRDSKTFTLTIRIEYTQPTDTLYIKCNPSVEDRKLLKTLLEDSSIIPDEYLYRPQDPYFGKASSVIYGHAFGIHASDLNEYANSVMKNHYWRQITLGEIRTAVARDEQGNIIYEVVYSRVVDNLVNSEGESISKEIFWPRFINLNLGPWYTSVNDIYASYGDVGESPEFYTSRTPGFARLLYPNSLTNMQQQVGSVLGQEFNFRLLPKWMTSQQRNGSTLGFVPAWVIAYTKPGFSEVIKKNIEMKWKDTVLDEPYTLNTINFKIDRFTVDKSSTFNYDKNTSPPAWLGLPSGQPAPDPKNTKDFHVIYPRETILPRDSQY
jgi:hypothetical protein